MSDRSESIQPMPVRFPRSIHEQLRRAAFDADVSMSAYVVEAVREKLGSKERGLRRRLARDILELDALDRKRTVNRGPYYSANACLQKLARGEDLPDPKTLSIGDDGHWKAT